MEANGKGLDYFSLQGQVVRITPEADNNYEIEADEGMLARVISVVDDSHGDDKMVKIELDFNDFKDHNARFQKANFYDKQGNPTLTWYESGLYGNGRDSIICMTETDKYLPPFVPVKVSETITVDECLDILKMVHEAGSRLIRCSSVVDRWNEPEFQNLFSDAERKARLILDRANRL
jgi:hypothetical protein